MDKVQKIREEVARIQLYTQSEVLKQVLDYIDEVQKEPVSEDLEEVSKNYALNYTPWDDCKDEIQEAFKDGAKWQKLKDMGITNNAKGVVTNILNSSDKSLDIYATEVAFIMLPANLTENYHMTNRDRISDAVRLGAKWHKEQMMEKAIDGYVIEDIEEGNGDFLLSADYLPKSMGLKDRQKVKVIVIKED